MFPTVRVSFRNLPDGCRFLVLLDIVPCDNKRYRSDGKDKLAFYSHFIFYLLCHIFSTRWRDVPMSGTPTIGPPGSWLASATPLRPGDCTHTRTLPSHRTSSPNRLSALRRSNWLIMNWTRNVLYPAFNCLHICVWHEIISFILNSGYQNIGLERSNCSQLDAQVPAPSPLSVDG